MVMEYDLEENGLNKWQVAMISMRIKKFYKKTGRKLQLMEMNVLDWNNLLEDDENLCISWHEKLGSKPHRLGYGDYRYSGILSYENEVLNSVFKGNNSTKDNIDAGDSEKEVESNQDCFELPIWHSYSSTNPFASKSADKIGGPREEEQVFLDDLARLQRQEKELVLPVQMRDYLFLTQPIPEDDSEIPLLEDIHEDTTDDALEDESWFDAMQEVEELLQFEIQKIDEEVYVFSTPSNRLQGEPPKRTKDAQKSGNIDHMETDTCFTVMGRKGEEWWMKTRRLMKLDLVLEDAVSTDKEGVSTDFDKSDSGEEDDEKAKDEMCLVAQASKEICLGVDLEPGEWIKDSGCSKHMTGNRKLFSSYKAYNGGNKAEDKICLAMIDENSTLWHRRLGHANMRLIQSLTSKELVRNLPKLKFDQHFCDAYKIRKQVHAGHKPKNIVSRTRCLELLHMDLYGPSAVRSYEGNRYTLVIVEDYFRMQRIANVAIRGGIRLVDKGEKKGE
ncbi:retrovirus-related pol polyprotein from transposon TNT 1-94 [Tanacetum coccineum]